VGVQLVEDVEFHGVLFYSTFSTNPRMVPPQDSPTFHAVSSATPNSSILGWPLSITSSASVTTAPSTQPPDTEPRKLPSSSMTRFDPTGRGAEPQVSTTVASATDRPFLRQSSAALRISLSVESIADLLGSVGCGEQKTEPTSRLTTLPSSPCVSSSLYSPKYRRSGDLLHQRFGVARPAAPLAQRGHEVGDRIQIVDRAEFVDMRQHRFDAAGARLKTLQAQERIEPDEPPAGAVQPVHVKGERIVDVAVEAVGNQKNDRALPEHPPRPELVERVQRR